MAPSAPLVQPPVQQITLRDGRQLAYSYFGVPRQGGSASSAAGRSPADGAATAATDVAPATQLPPAPKRTVLYFHGFASSRLEAGLLHGDAEYHSLSVVALDRPGAGGSTFNPNQVG